MSSSIKNWFRQTACLLLCLVLFFPTVSTATPVQTATSEAAVPAYYTLHTGSQGGSVWVLQTRLHSLGFYNYRVTGYYDALTRQAVRNFQWRYSMRVDGVAGPTTQAVIAHAIVKKRLIADTYRYRGIRYAWGGKSPATGFDCSGFIYYMFRTHGVYLGYHSSGGWYHMGYSISRSRLRPGDLVFFGINRSGVVSHVGFYIGNNNFISATSSRGIAIYSIYNPFWAPHYLGAKRVY